MTNIIPPHKRHQLVPAAYLVLIHNNKILLQRRCYSDFENGNYGFASGHVDAGETFTKTLIREIKEEIGIILDKSDVKIVHIMHRKGADSERIDVFYTTSKWVGEPKNMEPEKCDDLSWFDLNNLPKNTIAHIKFALEQIQKGNFYSEFGW